MRIAQGRALAFFIQFICAAGPGLGLWVAGCTDKNADNGLTRAPTDLEAADRAFGSFHVSCGADPDACHPAVAHLISKDHQTPLACTGFLIAADLLATAKHCLPFDRRAIGASLAGVTIVRFPPAGNHRAEAVEASTVVAQSNERALASNLYAAEWVVLKLSRPIARPPLRTSAAGVEDRQDLHLLAFDSDFSKGEAVMRVMRCPAVHRSIVNPYARARRSPFIAGLGCAAVNGNSGSPMLDRDGLALGILTAQAARDRITDLGLRRLMAKMPAISAYGTSFACVRAPTVGLEPGQLDPACEADRAEPADVVAAIKRAIESSFDARTEGDLAERLRRFQARNGDLIVHRVNRLAARDPGAAAPGPGEIGSLSYEFQPACVGSGLRAFADQPLAGSGIDAPIERGLIDVDYTASAEGLVSVVLRERMIPGRVRLTTSGSLGRGLPLGLAVFRSASGPDVWPGQATNQAANQLADAPGTYSLPMTCSGGYLR